MLTYIITCEANKIYLYLNKELNTVQGHFSEHG